jgi:RNA polymerase sigma factor (sigma-70 family)
MHPAPDRNPEEAALLRKARWGDHAAFATLYNAHAKAIHALAYRLTGNAAAAEDITQDTFLKMLGFLSGLRSDAPLRPWLKRVAANAAIDRLRRERRFIAAGRTSAALVRSGAIRRLAVRRARILWTLDRLRLARGRVTSVAHTAIALHADLVDRAALAGIRRGWIAVRHLPVVRFFVEPARDRIAAIVERRHGLVDDAPTLTCGRQRRAAPLAETPGQQDHQEKCEAHGAV